MKKLVKVEEVEGEGLLALMGQRITLYCLNYIYTGNLVGVNDKYVKLEKAGIVYNTGSYTSKDWEDYQALPNDWYVQLSSIESYGVLK